MKKQKIIFIIFLFTMMGAFFGFALYIVINWVYSNLLIHCLIMGSIFGLLNSFVALYFIKIYSDARKKNTRLGIEIRKDKLTGLYNRHAFENDIKYLDPGTVYSVIFLDIDNFKNFNNSFGHQVGDKILFDCATIILNSIRQTDLAYRYGGEEIVMLLCGCDKKEAVRLAEKIVESIRKHDNSPYSHITVSAGVASFPDDAHSFDQLVRASDSALLIAKNSGKDRVVVF